MHHLAISKSVDVLDDGKEVVFLCISDIEHFCIDLCIRYLCICLFEYLRICNLENF